MSVSEGFTQAGPIASQAAEGASLTGIGSVVLADENGRSTAGVPMFTAWKLMVAAACRFGGCWGGIESPHFRLGGGPEDFTSDLTTRPLPLSAEGFATSCTSVKTPYPQWQGLS